MMVLHTNWYWHYIYIISWVQLCLIWCGFRCHHITTNPWWCRRWWWRTLTIIWFRWIHRIQSKFHKFRFILICYLVLFFVGCLLSCCKKEIPSCSSLLSLHSIYQNKGIFVSEWLGGIGGVDLMGSWWSRNKTLREYEEEENKMDKRNFLYFRMKRRKMVIQYLYWF